MNRENARKENQMMKRLNCLIVLVFFLTLLVTQAESQAINLQGTVKGTDGRPISSASVKLMGPANYMAVTNSQGNFSIQNVMPGQYKVTVWQGNNYQDFSKNIGGGTLKLVVKW